ncbi:MAG: response regulator transcription factor [Roseibacillus sp.]
MPDSVKILVAEDDHHTREALVRILTQEGFQVIAASNGREALEHFQAEKPDLVCLDVMMPELDGYEVCKRIRREDAQVPLLFLTAKSEEIDTVVGLELGADDYVAKPFGVREILARIRAILRRTRLLEKKPSLGTNFLLGPLQVFPAELRAFRGEEEIQLSLRDLKILQLFHDRPSQVITRDELYNHAWGMDYFPNSRSLDQHISQLRKKIEPDPADPEVIKTVHGAGYRYH